MIISDQYRFVFLHIPKTGGTSIKRALYEFYNTGQIDFEGENVTDLNDYRPHTSITAEVHKQYSEYFKFAIVRNPWSWHASIWKFFQRPDRYNKLISDVPFGNYLEEVCRADTRLPYKRNQVDWISVDGVLLVDFVGRFEALREDFAVVLNAINLAAKDIELPHFKNAGQYDYRMMYTMRGIQLIAEKHSRDIEEFGYEFDKPLR